MKPSTLPVSLIALLCALLPVRADLVNRWSFNNSSAFIVAGTMFPDSVSGAMATVVGAGPTGMNQASFTGTALQLPGNGAANAGLVAANAIFPYIDLPNGIVSSKTSITVELWAAPKVS